MARQDRLQEAEDLLKELEAIERDSIRLFQDVPLIPEPLELGADGETVVAYVLRWHPNDIQKVRSRELAVRYDAWYQKASMLVQKLVPYQRQSFAEVRAIMDSYVTLNRYAAATAEMLQHANEEYEKGYVTVYLKEFASVIDSQANIVRSIASIPERKLLPKPRCFLTGTQCTVELWDNPKLVFVILPLSKEFNDIYEIGIKETILGMGWECSKSDEIIHTRNILCAGICQPIRSARFVIAELSSRNPNVLYELGLCHAFEKDVVLIAKDAANIPFDLHNQNVIIYETISDLRRKLADMLSGLTGMYSLREDKNPGEE